MESYGENLPNIKIEIIIELFGIINSLSMNQNFFVVSAELGYVDACVKFLTEKKGYEVMVLMDRKPWNGAMGILNIVLMNIPLFYNISTPNIGAWIYETTTGRLVWAEERSTFGDQPFSTPREIAVNLFADMENAVPRQLIK